MLPSGFLGDEITISVLEAQRIREILGRTRERDYVQRNLLHALCQSLDCSLAVYEEARQLQDQTMAERGLSAQSVH